MDKKPLILIADDEEDTRSILELLLNEAGYDIISSYDGLDTLDSVKSSHPQMILLDIMMPLVDGIEVCRRIKSDDNTKDIKIIMLSASDESDSKNLAMECGADDYITKPFDSGDLLKRIAKLLPPASTL